MSMCSVMTSMDLLTVTRDVVGEPRSSTPLPAC